jgi:1-deoxy-D-xylulose-5-phosphate reductoisomerase
MIKISLLGSTGSIGTQVLDVVRRHSDKFIVSAIAANRNSSIFLSQIKEFKPAYAGLSDLKAAEEIEKLIPEGVYFEKGSNVLETASLIDDADIIFVAVSGFVGIKAVINAINNKKKVAIATKEVLVAGGSIVTKLAKEKGVALIPVDSEHSAILQALDFEYNRPFKKLIITASGGAFRNHTAQMLEKITVKDALKHPNWNMGRKITIDSATLMNKGLEVIEAMWLYNCGLDKIQAVIHPESVIHSMVEFNDSSVLAQISYPTMEIPIQMALTYPQRLDTSVPSFDFIKQKSLNFYEIDEKKYPCYKIALECAKAGYNIPCAMNAANEVIVDMFLKEKIKYSDIPVLIERVLDKIKVTAVNNLDDLIETDFIARKIAREVSLENYANI